VGFTAVELRRSMVRIFAEHGGELVLAAHCSPTTMMEDPGDTEPDGLIWYRIDRRGLVDPRAHPPCRGTVP
jgi:hypothetical protein